MEGARKKRRTSKKQKQVASENEEDERLTSLLFGDGSSRIPDRHHEQQSGSQPEKQSDIFEIDRTGELVDGGKERRDTSVKNSEKAKKDDEKTQAWNDEDDDGDLQVNLKSRLAKLRHDRKEELISANELEGRLRNYFKQSLTARTDWAKLPEVETGDTEENKQSEATDESFLWQGRKLQSNILSTTRCPDANLSDPSQAVVQAVHFHPGSDPDRPLLLTAGLDKTLRFFQVGEDKSEKIHGIHFPKLPIYSASFLGDSGNVIVTGRRPFFYLYNSHSGHLENIHRVLGREEKSWEKAVASPDGRTVALVGNDGYIVLWDVLSRSVTKTLKISGSVRAITFSPDSQEIFASGSDGDVYQWEMRHSYRCRQRWSNQDGTRTSSLAASNRSVAVGAESGVVNLYQSSRLVKSIFNLSTSVDFSRFNHDGQILAISTRREKMGLKLLHVPSATVFSNWPTSKTPLGYVWSMDFSPSSRYMAIGNDKGKCLLYQLKHYEDA